MLTFNADVFLRNEFHGNKLKCCKLKDKKSKCKVVYSIKYIISPSQLIVNKYYFF